MKGAWKLLKYPPLVDTDSDKTGQDMWVQKAHSRLQAWDRKPEFEKFVRCALSYDEG